MKARDWQALALACRQEGAAPEEAHGETWRRLLTADLVTFPDQGPFKDRLVSTLAGSKAWEDAQRAVGLTPAFTHASVFARRELGQEVSI